MAQQILEERSSPARKATGNNNMRLKKIWQLHSTNIDRVIYYIHQSNCNELRRTPFEAKRYRT